MAAATGAIIWLLLISLVQQIQALPQVSFMKEDFDEGALEKRRDCVSRGDTIRDLYNDMTINFPDKWRLDDMATVFLQRCALKPGQYVLDLGAGAGNMAIEAKRIVGVKGRVVAVDTADLAIDAGRETARREQQRVKFFVEDFNNIEPLLIRLRLTYDVIMCSSSFQHVDDPVATLRLWAKYLKPGGRIVFDIQPRQSFPDLGAIETASEQLGLPMLRSESLLSMESPSDIKAVIKMAGLDGTVKKSPVYKVARVPRGHGEEYIKGITAFPFYKCYRPRTLRKKALELFNQEFDSRVTPEGYVNNPIFLYDAVAFKPNDEL